MMKKLVPWLLSAALFTAFLLTGCSGKQAPQAGSQTLSETVSFIDSAGRDLVIPAHITKVSPSGALAQMYLLAIAPDLLVTIASKYSPDNLKYIPAEVAALPMVGQFYGSEDLNLETVAAIGPEIVIDIGEPKKTIVEDMDSITESLAIPAIHITATLQSTPEAFRTLGKILNREAQGEALARYCETTLTQTDRIMTQARAAKSSILYCLGESGLNVLPAATFHAEVLDYMANNLAVVDNPASRGIGNETDLEQILLWNPEVILFSPSSVYPMVQDDPVWSKLRAVQNRTYYEVPVGPYNWMGMPPSINRYLGMIWLTKLLYPNFADFELYDQIREYYRLFYHYDLSRTEFDALTAHSLP